MRADFTGICVRCDHPIAPGQRIAKTRDGYAHADCAGAGE